MGNRAIITSHPFAGDNIGIYVHWNGGRASVEGFCEAAKRLGFRDPEGDPCYGLARLTQVIAQYFGPDGLSVGIGKVNELDTENGVYVIGRDWQIVERRTAHGRGYRVAPADWFREEIDPAKTAEIADAIVDALAAKEGV